jgi:hypothetical protein
MRKALLFTFFMTCCTVYSSFAQLVQPSAFPSQSSEKAFLHSQSTYNFQPYNGSAYMQQRLAQQNASFAQNLQSYLQALPSISQMSVEVNQNAPESSPPVLKIPVVVHVIHDSNDPVGTGTNLSINQIQSQIDKLNDAFRQMNANFSSAPLVFQGVAADAEIEFCLANVSPTGTATNGIDRQSVATSSIVDLNYIENTIKPSSSWNPAAYMNIWTVAIPNTTNFGGIQGYAYYPINGFAGANVLDGVVVDYKFFGTTGNAIGDGVACIREVGHYLGLPDTWGATNNQGVPVGCSSDDGLSDTPDQAAPTGLANPNCPITIPQSCGSNDMYSNYMDYMKDQTCQSMFTTQQATVMRAVLTGQAGSAGYGDRSSLIISGASACSNPCTIALNSSTTPESCGGLMDGTASVTASGGTPPYLYTWNTTPTQNTSTATGLAAGDHQVTVSDFTGCIQIATVTVSSASAVTGTIAVTNETCVGGDGTATITPSGGTGPYTVVWATSPIPQVGNTAIGLTEGAYAVSITDALGCGYTDFTIVYDDCNQECDTLFNNDPTLTPTVYFNPFNGGYISGTNGFNDQAKGDYFKYNGTNTHVVGIYYAFALAQFSNPTATIEMTVWDGTGGTPGAELGSQIVSLQTIATNIGAFQPSFIPLDTYIPVGSEFFVGFKMPNAANGDTVAITTTVIGDIPAGTGAAWEQWADGTWHSYQTSWGVDVNHGIVPVVATPPEVAFSSMNITACDSQTISFTNLTVNGSLFQWTLPGSNTPITNIPSPTVSYAIPGTYDVELIGLNGCVLDTVFAAGAVTINTCPTTCDLYATLSATSVTCNGGSNGSVMVTPMSGVGPYSILWNTGDTTLSVSNLMTGNYTVTITDATGCSVVGNTSVGTPTALSLVTSTTDESCANNDGSAMVVVTGGKMPYTYAWGTTPSATTDIASNLTAGTYIVTVTDANGCTSVASATVTDACTGCAMTLSTAFVSPVCNGETTASVSVTPSLGTGPYNYVWSSTISSTDSSVAGLAAGVYNVTVTDALNCVDSAVIVVTQPDELEIILSTVGESCADNDGVASSVATGGTAPYFYAWNTTPIQTTNQIIGLASGIYTGGVQDANGCIAIDSIMVMDLCPCGDTVMVSSTAETCIGNDGTATVTATGGQFSYLWSSGATDTMATVTGLSFGNYTVTVTDTSGCVTVSTVTVDDGCNCGMVLTTSSTGESCTVGGDGTATVSVSGIGQAPYTYTWNTTPVQTTKTAIGLSQGSYSVTVTDGNGCTQTATMDVEGTIAVTANIINASCLQNNGSAIAAVTGGDGNYTYLWNINGSAAVTETVTGLAAGSYDLTVTDGNGCTATTTGVVVQNGTYSVNLTGVDNFCSFNGASATAVAVGGGTAPYSFSWGAPLSSATTSSVNNLATGIYNVTVSDANGCTATNTVTVTSINAGPNLSVAQTNVSCFGDSDGAVDLTVNASTAVSIGWSNGVNSEDLANLAAGDYTVVIVDANGCIASTTVAISQPSPIVVTGVSTPTSTNTGSASAQVSGGTPPYTYAWNNGGTTQTINNLLPGTYNVTITDNNNCTNNGTIDVQQFTGTIDLASLTTFELYPNPSKGEFTVDVTFNMAENAEVIIMNVVGQRVWSQQIEGEQFRLPINLSDVASGVYFVMITTEQGRAVKRIVIE